MTSDSRPRWEVRTPPGGWSPPWPRAAELARAIPSNEWTLVGGLMVQLHAVHAELAIARVTVDVDIILHIETGATTFASTRTRLEELGYSLCTPFGDGPVHRFARGAGHDDQVDVMVADHLAPKHKPRAQGRPVFAVPAGTSALRKTVDARLTIDDSPV